MKKQPNVAIIKPALGTSGMSDTDFVSRLNEVHDRMLNNPAYPSPPVDLAGFKAAIDAYTAAVQAALDGGKSARTALVKQRANVTIMFRLLGHYVEAACKDDSADIVEFCRSTATMPQNRAAQRSPVSIIVVEEFNLNS
jgi:hypothetical protein